VSAINVTLRAGHDSTVRAELITRLSASWSSMTGHQSHQIFLALNEVDPSSSMEAAMILPSFGEESIWTRQHNRELESATPGCDPECRGFESRELPQTGCEPDGVHPLSAPVVG
jgi:hypothetical protein